MDNLKENGDDDNGEDDKHQKVIKHPVFRDLTGDEKSRLLAMLQSHERAIWLWTGVGIWAKWIVSVAAAVAIFQAIVNGYWKPK